MKTPVINSTLLFQSFVSLVLACFICQAKATTIDVLVVYTPEVSARYAGEQAARFQHLMNVSNLAYFDSGVDMQLRLVHSVEVEYTNENSASTALQDLTFKYHTAFNQIDDLRAQYGADLVIFYRSFSSIHGGCGLAWIGGNGTQGDFSASYEKNYAYSHVAVDTCADYVTAHELGHNMGLSHSRVQNGVGGTYDHALGHGEHGHFVTIMAYQSAFNVSSAGKVYQFSNPLNDCMGSPCGIDKNDPQWGADAAHTLAVVAPQIGDYFPTMVAATSADTTELEAELAEKQQALDEALFAQAQAQAIYDGLLAQQAQALVEYDIAYNNYLSTSALLNTAIISVNAAVNAYNNANAAGESYEVLMGLYSDYLVAYNVYQATAGELNTAVNMVNAWVATLNNVAQSLPGASAALNAANDLVNDLSLQVASLQAQIASA